MSGEKKRDMMAESTSPLFNRLPDSVITRVHQDIGRASMCWTKIEGAGTFDAEAASTIANNLCHYIADLLEVGKESIGGE